MTTVDLNADLGEGFGVEEGAIVTAGGARLATPIDSICVHGDSSHAVWTARAVRRVLERAGVGIRAFAA